MARTKSLDQLDKQIEALQREREAIRQKEMAGVIARIKEAIEHYGISAADLGLSPSRGAGKTAGQPVKAAGKRRGRKPAAGKKTASVVRFKDEAGNTWSGRGKRPNWFKAALAAGKTPEQLAA